MILLPYHPECWDYRYMPSYLAISGFSLVSIISKIRPIEINFAHINAVKNE
jgi:hypothetical protein